MLKDLRKDKCMTQHDLAERLGVKRSTLSMWEIGKSKPNLEMLKKIAKIFNCNVDELI